MKPTLYKLDDEDFEIIHKYVKIFKYFLKITEMALMTSSTESFVVIDYIQWADPTWGHTGYTTVYLGDLTDATFYSNIKQNGSELSCKLRAALLRLARRQPEHSVYRALRTARKPEVYVLEETAKLFKLKGFKDET